MSPRVALSRTFHSLRTRNYRLYFWGQVVSMSGTWLQSVALSWLVLKITGNGLALGVVAAVQFAPFLLAGPWGGVVADRVDKRRMLVFTQSASGALALALAVLVIGGWIQLWLVYALAFSLGLVNLVDMPTRQSFVIEMVGPTDLTNAVSLNSVVVNASRVIGPAVAGVLIATAGIGICFLLNAVSYLAVIAGLLAMRRGELQSAPPAQRGKRQLREGLAYAWSTPTLRTALLLMAVIGTLAYNFSIVLPLLARETFRGGPGAFGALFSLVGVGAVLGGLVFATIGRPTPTVLAGSAVAFGLAMWAGALAPDLRLGLAAMVPIGAASTSFIASCNTMLQLTSRPQMRGRMMALFAVLFLGSTPIGGPLLGWIAERFGPRAAFGVGASAAVVAGLVALAAALASSRKTAKRQTSGSLQRVPAEIEPAGREIGVPAHG
ncbi:MAG TPA: MFS transporter [Actinomycetota bacterium]|nr:MFS transporter [Actinomycetota bacterium]